MAKKIVNFLNGTEAIIKLGDITIAELQSIQFQEQIANQQIFGMGDYSAINNEPMLITGASGAFRIAAYSDQALSMHGQKNLDNKMLTAQYQQASNGLNTSKRNAAMDGNSPFITGSFSPAALLLEATEDITIYAKTSNNELKEVYKLVDVIITGYDISFAVGAQATEDYTFICRMVVDMQAEQYTKFNNNP